MSPGARRRRAAKRRRKGKTREARRISASDATIQLMVDGARMQSLASMNHELWLRSKVASAPFFKQVPPRHAMSGSIAFRTSLLVDEHDDPIWFTTRPDFAGIDRGVMPSKLKLFTHEQIGHDDDVVDALLYSLVPSGSATPRVILTPGSHWLSAGYPHPVRPR